MIIAFRCERNGTIEMTIYDSKFRSLCKGGKKIE